MRSASSLAPAVPEQQKTFILKTIHIMKKLYALAALVCGLFLFACSSSAAADTPGSVVEKFYAAINSENYQTAADCMYYDGKDIEKDKAMMVEILQTYLGPELKKLGGLKIKVLSEKIGEDGEAVVEFEMTGQGKTDKDTAKCVRDASGAWKMRAAF